MAIKIQNFGVTLALIFGLNLWNIPSAFAGSNFQLAPNALELQSSGRGILQNFYVKSTGNEPVAVQVRMVKVEIAPDGTEINSPEEEDFLVFPPQIIINGGGEQVVKITWVGEPEISKELIYRAIFEQLPINLSEVQTTNTSGITANVNVTVTYVASVYVTPNGAKPNLILESATVQTTQDGKNQLVVAVENQGNKRGSLKDLQLKLTSVNSPDKTVTIPGDQIKDDKGSVILAGNKRQFIIPLPEELPVGEVIATFEINR